MASFFKFFLVWLLLCFWCHRQLAIQLSRISKIPNESAHYIYIWTRSIILMEKGGDEIMILLLLLPSWWRLWDVPGHHHCRWTHGCCWLPPQGPLQWGQWQTDGSPATKCYGFIIPTCEKGSNKLMILTDFSFQTNERMSFSFKFQCPSINLKYMYLV